MNNNNSLIEIGKRIAEQRKESGLTQAQLAEKINVKREMINYWENGSRDIKSGNIVLLAEVLGVSIDWLLGMPNASKTTDKATKELCATLGLSDDTIKILSDPQNGRLREVVNFLFDQHNKTVAFDKKIQEWPVGKEIPEGMWSNLCDYASLLTNLSDFLSLCDSKNDIGISITDGEMFVTVIMENGECTEEGRIKHSIPVCDLLPKSVFLWSAEEKIKIITEILDDYSEMKFRKNIREPKYGY